MYAQTYLQRRGAVYQFRRRIPGDLSQAIGRIEIRCSLRTADRRAAEALVRAHAADLDRQWEQLRRSCGGSQRQTTAIAPVQLFLKPEQRSRNATEASNQPQTSRQTQASSQTEALSQPKAVPRHLKDTLPIWIRLSRPATSSIDVYRAAVRRFEEHYALLTLDEIRKSHLRDFVAHLQECGLAARTIHKEYGVVRTLLTIAEGQEWIASNPAHAIRLPKKQRKPKRSYQLEEVQRIFSSPVFSQGERPVAGKGECAYWIPVLLLYTGARREEICQLQLEHVRETDGVQYLAIDPRDDQGQLKTDESRRLLPIHPELKRLGFLQYVQRLRAEKQVRLFPALNKPNKRGAVGAKWGDWWRLYVRNAVGLVDPAISPAHSFRHLFISECRRLRIPDDYQRVMVGHRTRNADAHDNYGEHYIPALYEEISRIDFRGQLKLDVWIGHGAPQVERAPPVPPRKNAKRSPG